MAYTILRFAKQKGGAARFIDAHHERTKDEYASNPDIDKSRIAQNYHLVTPRWSYEQEIKHRIQMAGLPRAQGQREICGHISDGQSGICKGARSRNAGVFQPCI